MIFILDFFITMSCYMVYPLVKFVVLNKDVEFTTKDVNKTCIINSIVWAIIFLIIGINIIPNYEPNFAPAMIWYCINYSIYYLKYRNEDNVKIFDNRTKKLAILALVLVIIVILIYASIFNNI